MNNITVEDIVGLRREKGFLELDEEEVIKAKELELASSLYDRVVELMRVTKDTDNYKLYFKMENKINTRTCELRDQLGIRAREWEEK
jgi:hypothetical protein